MEYCKKCFFYNAEYDESVQQYDDTLKLHNANEKHYCPMYDSHIPTDIINGKKKCEFHIEKDKSNL